MKKDRRQNQEIIETTAVDKTEEAKTTDTATDDASDEEPKAGVPVKVENESFVKKVGRGIARGAKKVWTRKLSIGEIVLGVGGAIAIITGIKAIYNKGRKDAGDGLEDYDFNEISDEEYEALTGEEPEKEESEETVETEVVDDSEETEEEYDDEDVSEEETEYEDEDVIEEEDE